MGLLQVNAPAQQVLGRLLGSLIKPHEGLGDAQQALGPVKRAMDRLDNDLEGKLKTELTSLRNDSKNQGVPAVDLEKRALVEVGKRLATDVKNALGEKADAATINEVVTQRIEGHRKTMVKHGVIQESGSITKEVAEALTQLLSPKKPEPSAVAGAAVTQSGTAQQATIQQPPTAQQSTQTTGPQSAAPQPAVTQVSQGTTATPQPAAVQGATASTTMAQPAVDGPITKEQSDSIRLYLKNNIVGHFSKGSGGMQVSEEDRKALDKLYGLYVRLEKGEEAYQRLLSKSPKFSCDLPTQVDFQVACDFIKGLRDKYIKEPEKPWVPAVKTAAAPATSR